jgi:hypothetical protein
MKTRSGFVSNSSSSSFCILGKEIQPKDIDFNENIFCKFWPDWGEGNIFFKVTPEILEYLETNQHYSIYRKTYFIVYASGEYNVQVEKSKLPDKFNLYAFELAHAEAINTVKDLERCLEY